MNRELRTAARRSVSIALKTGAITRPENCEDCKKRLYLTAHHDDYAKPLDVKWLCHPCHGKISRASNRVGAVDPTTLSTTKNTHAFSITEQASEMVEQLADHSYKTAGQRNKSTEIERAIRLAYAQYIK